MDRGAWQATVHRFTKSQTRLKRLSMHRIISNIICKIVPDGKGIEKTFDYKGK